MKMGILTFGFLWLAGCGGGGLQEIQFTETTGEVGYVHLNISNTAGSITQFRIQIEGDDFATLTQTLSSAAAGAQIRGIPQGVGRTIRIWALNAAGQTLREGVLENVTIEGGQAQSLDISLQAVPVILNLTNEGYQSNRRLYFHVLTDPDHRVGVAGYRDLITEEAEKQADADGLVRFYPGVLDPGNYSFQIIDHTNGKETTLQLRLWEGLDVEPAPLVAAGLTDTSRLGQALVGGNYFPNIVEALWEQSFTP